MWRDKVLIASVVGYLALLGGFWWAYASGTDFAKDEEVRRDRRELQASGNAEPLKVTVFDQVSTAGREVSIAAKFEHDGPGPFNRDRKGLRVVIGLERATENLTVEATTDGDGVAVGRFSAPREAGQYHVFAHAKEPHAYAPRLVRVPPGLFVYPSDQPMIVCDLDGTVTESESLDVMSVKPQADAARVLTALSMKFALVYLTARDEGFLDRSRDWLEQHGFPRGPVLCRDWTLTNLRKQAEAKHETLEALKTQFPMIAWGIGNAKSDRNAYRAAGISHLIVRGSGEETVDGVRTIGVAGWTEIEKIILQVK